MYLDLIRQAGLAGERVAIEHVGRRCTYSELADAARRVAGGLRAAGIEPGDAVAVMLPNGLEWPMALYGASMNGNVVVPINVMLAPRELEHILVVTGARVLVVGAPWVSVARAATAGMARAPTLIVVGERAEGCSEFASLRAHAPIATPAPYADDTHALTMFTSGTTGRPKGAVLTVGNLRAQVDMVIGVFAPSSGDRVLCPLPLFHSFGLNGVLQVAIRYGGTVVLQSKFDPQECLAALAEGSVAWFAGVPTMYAYLLAATPGNARVGAGLRYCVSGGAPLTPTVAREFEQRFGAPIFNGYGLTETVFAVCCNRPGPGGRKDGAVGTPLDGVSLRVLDEAGREVAAGAIGEIAVSGGVVMRGYWNAPEATREILRDGWLHTGDVGYVDDDGFCFLVDRKRDLIIKGGYNIYPKEVEDALGELAEVKDVAVVGVEDDLKGERVCAVVVVRHGATLGELQLRAHVAERLAKYKHPNEYRFVDALPRGATGKVLKARVRQELAAARSVPSSAQEVRP